MSKGASCRHSNHKEPVGGKTFLSFINRIFSVFINRTPHNVPPNPTRKENQREPTHACEVRTDQPKRRTPDIMPPKSPFPPHPHPSNVNAKHLLLLPHQPLLPLIRQALRLLNILLIISNRTLPLRVIFLRLRDLLGRGLKDVCCSAAADVC
jgi:hypothetical protein